MKNRTMYILMIFLGIAFTVWFLYSWLSVRAIEEPVYQITTQTPEYEIRAYAPYIIAETVITGAKNRDDAARKGFPIVAGYIFGNNTTQDKITMTSPVNTEVVISEKIAMTVPVNTEKDAGTDTYRISFVMPAKYTLDTLPTPNDSRVTIKDIPSRQVAVRRFTWSANETAIKKQEEELLSSLARDGIQIFGQINVARYNPPGTLPFMLRNEVQIQVNQ